MPEPKDDKEAKKIYKWSFDKGTMNCCASEESSCKVAKLWDAATSQFHDADLQQATWEINDILKSVRKMNPDPEQELHFVQIEDRHLLAWVRSDLVGSSNDDQTISKMLRLKSERSPRATTRRARTQSAKGGQS